MESVYPKKKSLPQKPPLLEDGARSSYFSSRFSPRRTQKLSSVIKIPQVTQISRNVCNISFEVENFKGTNQQNAFGQEFYCISYYRGPNGTQELLKTTLGQEKKNLKTISKSGMRPIDCSAIWYIGFEVFSKGMMASDSLVGTLLIPFGKLTQPIKSKWFRLKGIFSDSKGEIQISVKVSLCDWNEYATAFQEFRSIIQKSAFQLPMFPKLSIPGIAEVPEIAVKNVTLTRWNRAYVGDFYVTNYRVVFFAKRSLGINSPEDEEIEEMASDDCNSPRINRSNREIKSFSICDDSLLLEKVSFAFPFSNVMKLSIEMKDYKDKKLKQTLKNIPIKELRMGVLLFELYDFHQFTVQAHGSDQVTGKEIIRSLKKVLDYKLTPDREVPAALQLVSDLREAYPNSKSLHNLEKVCSPFSMSKEFKRQEISDDFKMSHANLNYDICSSYPSELYFPASTTLRTILGSAKFRGKHRLPVLTYYSSKFGCAIARCSQPHSGLTGKRSSADEELLGLFRDATSRKGKFYFIYDARSAIAAEGNAFKGMGYESVTSYPRTKILFMNIANIHAIRQSEERIRGMSITEDALDSTWLSQLENSKWLHHIRSILLAATRISQQISQRGCSVLVHCSDGWDRTSQLCALAQILLDKKYRTVKGLKKVVEKDFLAFGHKFEERLGHFSCPDQRSSIFVQFLDCIYQVMEQFPRNFEYTSSYLVALACQIRSGWFGTFLYNTEKQRREKSLEKDSFQVWTHLEMLFRSEEKFRNSMFDPDADDVIFPSSSVKNLKFWSEYYLQHDSTDIEALENKDLLQADFDDVNEDLLSFSWLSDDMNSQCMDCRSEFSILRRRYYCRLCNRKYCHQCLSQKIILPEYGNSPQKICHACHEYAIRLISARSAEIQEPQLVDI